MEPLARALIEKAGQEQGWERCLGGDADSIVLASARHRACIRVVHPEHSLWLVTAPEGLISAELARSFPHARHTRCEFAANSLESLSQLLRRAAELAQSLPDHAQVVYAAEALAALSGLGPLSTEAERMVRQRIGQAVFRDALLRYWGRACAVTSISLTAVLRASHARPWADCSTDAQRLDVYNGFLLTANLDALFDRGLLSFDDHGMAMLDPRVPARLLDALGVRPDSRLRWLSERHLPYLQWHRKHVFGALEPSEPSTAFSLAGTGLP